MSGLEFTGERFVPGVRGEIWIEHWHRYHFAARCVAGKRVLDVACGEGYGTALRALRRVLIASEYDQLHAGRCLPRGLAGTVAEPLVPRALHVPRLW